MFSYLIKKEGAPHGDEEEYHWRLERNRRNETYKQLYDSALEQKLIRVCSVKLERCDSKIKSNLINIFLRNFIIINYDTILFLFTVGCQTVKTPRNSTELVEEGKKRLPHWRSLRLDPETRARIDRKVREAIKNGI